MKHHFIRISRPLRFIIIFFLIIGGTVALVGYGQGYFYDMRTGEIRSSGLVMLDSEPEDARVWVNGEEVNTTPRRLRLSTGEHEVEIFHEGYRSWEKSFEVSEGQVINAQYPLLIPEDVETVSIDGINYPAVMSLDNDGGRMAVAHGQPATTVSLLSSDNSEADEWFDLPNAFDDYRITSLDWSDDDSRLLVEVATAEDSQYLVVARGQASVQPLDELFNAEIDRAAFGVSGNRVYGLSDGQLLRLDLGVNESQSIAENVIDWSLVDETMYLLQRDSSGRVRLIQSGGEEELYHLGHDSDYILYGSEYGGSLTMAVHDRTNDQVTLITDNDGEVSGRSLRPRTAENVSISPNQRFVLMYSQEYSAVYDIDEQHLHQFNVQDRQSHLNWYGSYHLTGVVEDNAVIMEFDGSNMERLGSAEPGIVNGLPSNGDIYSVGRNMVTDDLLLQRSELE